MARQLTAGKRKVGGFIGARPVRRVCGGDVSNLANGRPLYVMRGGFVEFGFFSAHAGTPVLTGTTVNGLIGTRHVGDALQNVGSPLHAATVDLSITWTGEPVGSPVWTIPSGMVATATPGRYLITSLGDKTVVCSNGQSTETLVISNPVYAQPGVTYVISETYDAGSFRKVARDYIVSLTSGKDPVAARDKFSVRTFNAGNQVTALVYNPNHWLKDHDTTCVSIGNSLDGPRRCGTLVSPRHFIHADHYPLVGGNTIQFADRAGNIHTRTVTNAVRVGSTDCRLGVLDQDLPASIRPAVVPPTSFLTKIPTDIGHIPVVFYNQYGRFHASVIQTNPSSTWNNTFSMYATGDAHYRADAYPYGAAGELPGEPWAAFYSRVLIGDSGSPQLILLPGQTILMSTFFGIGGGGYSTVSLRSQINEAMTTLGGGYQLTDADFSGLKNY